MLGRYIRDGELFKDNAAGFALSLLETSRPAHGKDCQ
jgi:hypothetical protein